jgi:hypothetical protein
VLSNEEGLPFSGIERWHKGKEQAREVLRRRTRENDKLPMGSIKAINAAKWRVPDDAPEAVQELADRALERIAAVMDGMVPDHKVQSTLKAAIAIREEVCGPPVKKLEVEGKMGLMALLTAAERLDNTKVIEVERPVVPQLPPPTGLDLPPVPQAAQAKPPIRRRPARP